MITVWKLSGRDQWVVQFSPADDLVFDVRDLSGDQRARIEAQGGRAFELASANWCDEEDEEDAERINRLAGSGEWPLQDWR